MGIRRKFLLLGAGILLILLIFQLLVYMGISLATRRIVERYSSGIVEQINRYIGNIFDATQTVGYQFSTGTTVDSYLLPDDDYQLYTAWKGLSDEMTTILNINTSISDILIYRTDGKLRYRYSNSADSTATDILDRYTDYFEGDSVSSGFMSFSDIDKGVSLLVYVEPIIYTAGVTHWGEHIGTAVIVLNQDSIKKVLADINLNDHSRVYLIDNKNKVLFSTDSENVNAAALLKKPSVISQQVNHTSMSIVFCVDLQSSLRNYGFYTNIVLIVTFLITMMLLLFLNIMDKSIVNPIMTLHNEIVKVTTGGLKKRIAMNNSDEIGRIAEIINQMLDHQTQTYYRVLETQQRLYESELSKKESELIALESQVNPHFLFNTLECIYGIATAYGVPMITDVAENLSDIFYYSTRGKEIVTLKEEIRIVYQYLKIIDVRFCGSFTWDIDVPNRYLGLRIPKMILQPLVENAVYHGLEKKGKGSVRLHVAEEGGDVLIRIEDNGAGIPADRLAHLHEILGRKECLQQESIRQKKIGIANTCWRIKLIFGDAYGVAVDSTEGTGTQVTVRLPYRLEKDGVEETSGEHAGDRETHE